MRSMRDIHKIANIREAGRAEWNAFRCAALRDGKEIPEGGKLELVENAAGEKELQIRGYVWVDMVEELDRILEEFDPETLVVRINSGGGSAFTGFEIANRLRGINAHVITRNESAAMSAAAVIFLAGDERQVGSMGTSTMFHDARGFIDILEFGPVDRLEQGGCAGREGQGAGYAAVVESLDPRYAPEGFGNG